MNNRDLGPFVHAEAGKGVTYRLDKAGSARCRIRLSPDTTETTEFSLVEVELAPSASVELGSYRWIDRVIFGLTGQAELSAGCRAFTLAHEGVAFVGRGNDVSLRNTSDQLISIGVASYPPGPEARSDLLIEENGNPCRRSFSNAERALLGIVDGTKADSESGPVTYIGPDDGPSFWQADPSAGFVTVKLSSDNLPTNQFSVLVQSLEPGAYVRQHGHARTDEIIVVTSGEGIAKVEGQDYPLMRGSVVFLGRNLIHGFHNVGQGNLNLMGFFNPPGIEGALSETGVPRGPGETRPKGIVRNAATGRILVEKFGFVLPDGGG